jgi:hypothetical protein
MHGVGASDGLLRPSPEHGNTSLGQTLPAPPKSSRLHPQGHRATVTNEHFEPGFPRGLNRSGNPTARTSTRDDGKDLGIIAPSRGRHPLALVGIHSEETSKAGASSTLSCHSNNGADHSTAQASLVLLAPLAPAPAGCLSGRGSLTDRPRHAGDDLSFASSRRIGGGLSRGNCSTAEPLGPPMPKRVAAALLDRIQGQASSEVHSMDAAGSPRLDRPFAPRLGPRGRGFGPPPTTAPSPKLDSLSQRRPLSKVPPKTADLSPMAKASVEPLPPRSIVPLQYHIREAMPVRPPEQELGSYAADWDAYNEMWQVTIFPAQRPEGREQVGHLRNCLNRMLNAEGEAAVRAGILPRGTAPSLLQILDGSPDADRTYRVLHSIYAAGVHELARQVSSNCAERGQLLINVWSSVEALRERMLQLREDRVHKAERETQKLHKELAQANERLQALELLEASNMAKTTEIAKITQSREQLLEMMRTLQAALTSLEEQLHSSLTSRKVAETKLRTWLPNYDAYSTAAALEALEAHEAATREFGGGDADASRSDGPAIDPATMTAMQHTSQELKARAEHWRASVRAQAAQLADWESPPAIPDRVPITADALRFLMQDAGRILGAVVCMHADEQTPEQEADSGGLSSERAARDQQTITSLQAQLTEARAQIHAQHVQLSAASSAPNSKSKRHAGGGSTTSLIMPHGAVSLELPMEPL